MIEQRTKLASEVASYRIALASEAGAVAELLKCSLKREKSISITLDSLTTKDAEAKHIITGVNSLLPTPSALINKNNFYDEKITAYTDVFINLHRTSNNAQPSIDSELSGEKSNSAFQDLMTKLEATGCRNAQMKFKRSSSAQFEASINKLNNKIEDVTEQIRVINTHGMDEQEAANWKESEADDIGYQLYNNTGLATYGFTWIYALTGAKKAEIETNGNDPNLVKKMATYCSNKGEVERGTRSHPVACWRILNVLSEQRNKALIERNIGNLPVETVFSKSPSLKEVHEELKRER